MSFVKGEKSQNSGNILYSFTNIFNFFLYYKETKARNSDVLVCPLQEQNETTP
jgi:hypothetical protein